ncbi:m160 protein [Murid betaherpesvirus 1]|uniref:M160 protein n=1 Tax=Murid herpesvirus 1 TaxID=10366 RepID=H2A3G2_MUHV1|nr:m160 protein [Murid betaherpesvirus 1]
MTLASIMHLITKLCLLLGYLIQINNASYEVSLTIDNIDINEMKSSCTSTISGESDSENVHGFWLISCLGNNTVITLATFGPTGYRKKHPSVTGISSRSRHDIHLPGSRRDSSDSSSSEEQESITGPSSTIIIRPVCDGMIICKVGKDVNDNTGSDAKMMMGPLNTTHNRIISRSGETLEVVMSCKPYNACGGYNVSWYYSPSSSTTFLGNATFWNATLQTDKGTSYKNETLGSEKLKWKDGYVQVNGSLWSDDTTGFCVWCQVDTCGITGKSLVCDSGYRSAYYSAGHRVSAPSLHQMLIVLLGIFFVMC